MASIDIILYFITYSFMGWCCESIYCSIGSWKWINRGFLNGPFCPVYGVGAVLTLAVLQFIPGNIFLVFFGGMLVTSTLEYMTGWIMEKIFHARWWDYSAHRFNIHGRVCLLNSTLFGCLCVLLYFGLHPAIYEFYSQFSIEFKLGFLTAFCLYLIADLGVSVWSAFGLKLRLQALGNLRNELLNKYPILNSRPDLTQLMDQIKKFDIQDELFDKIKGKKLDIGWFEKRLLRAFPGISSNKYNDFLTELKESMKNKKHHHDHAE